MYHQFNIHKFYVLPPQCIMGFEWLSEQTAIISLYSINWLVFITEMQCVYCAVQKDSLLKSEVSFRLHYSVVTIYTAIFSTNGLHFVHTVYLRVPYSSYNSDYYCLQHQLIGFM